MSTDELKPCPFCGGEAFIRYDESHSTAFFVGCSDWDCFGNMMWAETEAEARRKWNTRAESAEVIALREREARLVEALREAREAAHSVAHSEYDGVWNETDFSNFTPLADAALAEIEKEAEE